MIELLEQYTTIQAQIKELTKLATDLKERIREQVPLDSKQDIDGYAIHRVTRERRELDKEKVLLHVGIDDYPSLEKVTSFEVLTVARTQT